LSECEPEEERIMLVLCPELRRFKDCSSLILGKKWWIIKKN